jgi:hypothetical protein
MILFPPKIQAETKHEVMNDRHVTRYTTASGSGVEVEIWKSYEGFLMRNTTYHCEALTVIDAIAILRYHQSWRRGKEKEMINSKILGIAIDVVLEKIENEG